MLCGAGVCAVCWAGSGGVGKVLVSGGWMDGYLGAGVLPLHYLGREGGSLSKDTL